MSRKSVLLKSVSIALKAVSIAASWTMLVWWWIPTMRIGLSVGPTVVIIAMAVVAGCGSTAFFILLNRRNIGCAARTGIITLATSFCFALVGGTFLMPLLYVYDHGFGETGRCMSAGGLFGAIVGTLLSMSISHRRSLRPPRHGGSAESPSLFRNDRWRW